MTSNDIKHLRQAIEISRKCTPSQTAYSVGCVIQTIDGAIYEGYTHETAPDNHAEEEAINKALRAGATLEGATIYTSMEPCSTRKSKPVSCSELIMRFGMARVVYAYAEPDCFVDCNATSNLRDAGVRVDVLDELADLVIEINKHIINR